MVATRFPCVSPDSGTNQLHDSPAVDGHAQTERLVSIVNIATVTEERSSVEHRFVVRFLGAWGLDEMDIHKSLFLYIVTYTTYVW
jgi:hypothetical protein